METCKNCGKSIGALQTAHLVNDLTYCDVCAPAMRRKASASANPIPYASPGRPAGPTPRMLGLSVGESWIVGIVGLLLAPAMVGIPLVIWAWLAQRRHVEAKKGS